MRILQESEHTNKFLEYDSVKMTTEDFVRLCERFGSLTTSFSVEVEMKNGSTGVLDSIEDIKNHSPSIRVPVKMKADGISIEFSYYRVQIMYKIDQESAAMSMYSEIGNYAPFLTNRPYMSSFIVFIFYALLILAIGDYGHIILSNKFQHVTINFVLTVFMIIFYGGIILYTLPPFKKNVIIRHRRTDTVWSRNADRIIVGVISGCIGLAVAWFSKK